MFENVDWWTKNWTRIFRAITFKCLDAEFRVSNYQHFSSASQAIMKCHLWDVPSISAPIRNGSIQYPVQWHLQSNWQLHSCNVLMLPLQNVLIMQITEWYGRRSFSLLALNNTSSLFLSWCFLNDFKTVLIRYTQLLYIWPSKCL